MKRKAFSVFAVLMALAMTLGCMPVNAVYVTDETVAGYTVTNSEVHTLAEGLVYNQFDYTDDRGIAQTCFAMEFNPSTTPFRSYVYHSKASHGYTIVEDVESAQREGLEVYGAINGDFFSMESANYGTPIGLYVTEGKLVVSSVGLSQYNLVIDKDGKADVVYSKLAYGVHIGGTNYGSSLTAVNKRAVTYSTSSIYYFDSDIGSATPTSGARTELVCDITEGTLSVGGTLSGTVSSVSTAGGTAIGANQFVLSTGADSALASTAVGTEVQVQVVETIEDSKTAMENAYHAIYAHQVMKVDGYDRWANGDINDPGLSEQFAQRCVFGIKEDGTIIYLVCDGRKTQSAGSNGWDYDMLMEIMEPYNCTDIINFDGGGSTAFVIAEEDGKLNYEFIGSGMGTGRTVANSILIVRDPEADPISPVTPDPIVDAEGTELRNVAINKSYAITQYGNSAPTYMSTAQGDLTGRKLTNGLYRTADNTSANLSMACIGTNSQLHAILDLEQVREDMRSIVWRGVSVSSNCSFKSDNVIVYVSEDGIHWSKSVAGEISSAETDVDGVSDYTYSFTEAQKGRYVKLVFGNTSYVIQFDEIEVYAMVDEDEPVEEPLPEDTSTLPADIPSENCENVALGGSYTLTCDGNEIAAFYDSADIRYYSALTAEGTPQKLTDGRLGTEGSFGDGCTLGFRSGTGKPLEIILDLGENNENVEFVQLLHVIDNSGSFGKLDSADISYRAEGDDDYTLATCRVNLEAITNTHYYDLTLQLNTPATARYIKVNFLTPKFLFGFGELTVLTSAVEGGDEPSEDVSSDEPSFDEPSEDIPSSEPSEDAPSSEDEPALDITYGDVNGDGFIDSLDAAQALKHDAMLTVLEDSALVVADVNGDGTVDSLDAAMILKYDAGLITEF